MGPKQKWSQFYCQWANKLTEAAGDIWPDDVKISLLRTTLNMNLKLALASNHLIPDDDFSEFVRIVSKIPQQHDEILKPSIGNQGFREALFSRNGGIIESRDNFNSRDDTAREWGNSGTERGPIGGKDRANDTFMGGINSAQVLRGPGGKPLRAK